MINQQICFIYSNTFGGRTGVDCCYPWLAALLLMMLQLTGCFHLFARVLTKKSNFPPSRMKFIAICFSKSLLFVFAAIRPNFKLLGAISCWQIITSNIDLSLSSVNERLPWHLYPCATIRCPVFPPIYIWTECTKTYLRFIYASLSLFCTRISCHLLN